MLNVWWVPAVFTRVSSSSQWILSAANLSRHPDHFTLDLNITQLSLPGSICSQCILWRKGERESICILWRGRERERGVCQNLLYLLLYTATPSLMHLLRKPAKASPWQLMLGVPGPRTHIMLTYADACWRMLGVPGWAEEVAAYRLVMRIVCNLMHISSDDRLNTL